MKRYGDEKRADLIREVDGHVFYLVGGVWTDQRYQAADKDRVIKVKAFSDEYFKLLSDRPDLRKYFALAEHVLVKLGDQIYEVVD